LTIAVANGDLPCCHLLLEHGAPVALPGLLTLAVRSRHFDCCALLVDRGAPIDDEAFLCAAETEGCFEFCRLFVEHGTSVGDRGRCWGGSLLASVKDQAAFEYLLENGANVTSALPHFVGSLESLTKLFDHGADAGSPSGEEALAAAARAGDIACVELLIRRGAPVTPAVVGAAGDGPIGTMPQIVGELLDAGGSAERATKAGLLCPQLWPRLLSSGAKAGDIHGADSLREAVFDGNEELGSLLLANGAFSHGEDLLKVWKMSRSFFDAMLQSCADPSTGLESTVGDPELLQILLGRGCRVPYQALRMAVWSGRKESVDLLLAHGASWENSWWTASWTGSILHDVVLSSRLGEGIVAVRELEFLVKKCGLPIDGTDPVTPLALATTCAPPFGFFGLVTGFVNSGRISRNLQRSFLRKADLSRKTGKRGVSMTGS
jgi:ankyrin repeat protein